ncbi:hypothetical protein BJ165DRAFT_1612462 [Panaeolus papilionaceus]|nr:hypothetical protein BJ165DRAFT_1612462 [Panaeolus papilionaceus]
MRFLSELVPLDDEDAQSMVGEEAQAEGESEGDLSSSPHTLIPGQGSTGTTETTPTSKVTVLTKNRLFTFPNGLLTRVGLVHSTTTSTVTSASNATIPTTMIPSSSQADVQPAPPTQNPTASSPSLSPSPSQRLIKSLTTRSVHIEPRALSRVRSRPHSLPHSQSFYTGTFNSAQSGSISGFSTYHTPDASVGSFSSEAGLGLIRRSEVGGGAGSSRCSDVGMVTTEGGEWELYDAHTDISASGSLSVSVNGLGFGSWSASSSSLGVRGMAGSRIVSRRVSSVGLRNGDGLEEANGSGSGEPRRTSSLATLTNLTVHGEMTGSTTPFVGILLTTTAATTPKNAKKDSYRHLHASQPPLAITTTVSGSSTTTTATAQSSTSGTSTSTGATSVGGDNDGEVENQNKNVVGNGTGNESESSESAVTITPARLMMFGSSSSLSLPSISTSSAAHAHPSPLSSKSALTAHSRLGSTISSGASYQPARGPALFLTSAKTGFNVEEVFHYVARRVVERWDEEDDEAETEAEVIGSARGGMEVGGSRRGRGRGRTTGRGRGRGNRKLGDTRGGGWVGGVGNVRDGTVRLAEEDVQGRCAGCAT